MAKTNLAQYSRMIRLVVTPLVAQEALAGALPTLYAATAGEVSGGDYYGPQGVFEITGPPAKAYLSKHARNDESAQKLWDLSEHLTGVTYAI